MARTNRSPELIAYEAAAKRIRRGDDSAEAHAACATVEAAYRATLPAAKTKPRMEKLQMRVSRFDLHTAADWLDCYDGGREESPAMARVAAWLRKEAETRYVREAAREHGKPMAEMRVLIDEMMRR